MLYIKKVIIALVLSFTILRSQAGFFICNIDEDISKFNVIQAYSGQPVLLNTGWVTVFALPSEHPSNYILASIGVSPSLVEQMAKPYGIIDRGIRIVKTEQEMIRQVNSTKPSVGYVRFYTDFDNTKLCFVQL